MTIEINWTSENIYRRVHSPGSSFNLAVIADNGELSVKIPIQARGASVNIRSQLHQLIQNENISQNGEGIHGGVGYYGHIQYSCPCEAKEVLEQYFTVVDNTGCCGDVGQDIESENDIDA